MNVRKLVTRAYRSALGRVERSLMRAKYRLFKAGLGTSNRSGAFRISQSLLTGNSVPWIIQDNRWGHIVHRWRNRKLLHLGLPIPDVNTPPADVSGLALYSDGSFEVSKPARSNDEWVYLYLAPASHCWRNFSWTEKFTCGTRFKELQFGFRYRDFYNRYRYRFQDDQLFFDIVSNGQFLAGLTRRRFPLEMNRAYEIEIRAADNMFECWVDGTMISRDYDPIDRFRHGSIAIILWEDDGSTDIVGTFSAPTVHELLPANPSQTLDNTNE